MSEADHYPTFDETDRSIFAIEESRERADKMRDFLVPKLREIAQAAFSAIEDVYKVDPLSTSTESLSPEHRPEAKKTRAFDEAAAGLVMRQVGGKYHYLKLRFNLTDAGLVPFLEASRPVESEAFLRVLRDHKNDIIELFEQFDINIWTQESHGQNISNHEIIESSRVDHRKQWWNSGLIGSLAEYPIDSDEYVDRLVEQFVAMFMVFQTTCERLTGVEDHFPAYFESLLGALDGEDDGEEEGDDSGDEDDGEEEGDDSGDVGIDAGDSLNPEPSAIEGEILHAMRQHRRREQRLRDEKIRQVVQSTGRLRCEVPGCGFDFFEVYGEIGEGFAHVHHLQPLADRLGPSQTKTSDLAIVCANCHAMIHRGDGTRPLESLILKK